MRKIAFAVCLIGLLIGSTLGGLALADKGGDPDYGSSPLGEIEEISDKIGNITDMLDNPEWGLAEIKREIASIEGNVTSIFGNVTELKADIAKMVAPIELSIMTLGAECRYPGPAPVRIRSTVTYKGLFPLYDVYVKAYENGVYKAQKHFDVLYSGETDEIELNWSGECACQWIKVEVTGKDLLSNLWSDSDLHWIDFPCPE